MLNSKSTLFMLLTSTILLGCSQSSGIKNNETVRKVFSSSEAQGLEEIHDFFTDKICAETGKNDPAECYETYMLDLKAETPSTGVYPYFCSKSEQDELLNNLDTDLFSEIWRYENVAGGENNGSWTEIELNHEGKYAEFLDLLGNDYLSINEYQNALHSRGALTSSIQTSVLMFPENYDVQDERIRLVIAIHYLTVCYQP